MGHWNAWREELTAKEMGVLSHVAFAFREDEHVAYAKDEALEPAESLCSSFNNGIVTHMKDVGVVERPLTPSGEGPLSSLIGMRTEPVREENFCDKTPERGIPNEQDEAMYLPYAEVLLKTRLEVPSASLEDHGRREAPDAFSGQSGKQRVGPLFSPPRPPLPSGARDALACLPWLKRQGRLLFSLTRWHLLVLLCCYSVLVGPVYLNWAPFRQLLFDNGVYRWVCDPQETDASHMAFVDPRTQTCAQQRLHVGNLFTLCTVADYGMSFFGGLAMDVGGPKVASVGGSLLMTLGWLLLAFASETFRAFELGMVLFGLGIDMAFYGTLPVGTLFPGHCNTVRAVLVAMRSVSYMTPVLLQTVASSLHISYRDIMVGYAVTAFGPALLIAAFVTPWKPWEGRSGVENDETAGGKADGVPANNLQQMPVQTSRRTEIPRNTWRLCASFFPRKLKEENKADSHGVDGAGNATDARSAQKPRGKNAWDSESGKGESDETSARTPVTTDQTVDSLKHPAGKEGDSWPAAIPTDTGSLSMISLSSSPKRFHDDAPAGCYIPRPSDPALPEQTVPDAREASLFSREAPCLRGNETDETVEETPVVGLECGSADFPRQLGTLGNSNAGADERRLASFFGQPCDRGRRDKVRQAIREAVAFTSNYLFSSLYLPLVPYFTITLIRAVYFNTASHDLVPDALTFLHIIIGFVFVFPPIAGYIADRFGILLCMALVNSCGTLVILLSLVTLLMPGKAVWLEYVIAFLFMQNMSLMTNQIYFYVGATFPQRHLGKLIGFTCTVGGLLSLLATPMFDYSVKSGESGFMGMLTLLAALSGVTYLLLLVLHFMKKRTLKRQAETATPCTAVLAL
ncbi:putative transmembrane protein [Toxoplasma gondii MAS]|uniref:Putative transmembrane protein n=2 Tax=Toxoplasma gondii TaxID=5811 RepID=A0A086Q4Q9_TOXGO|nr:putative transmembrane protein [Toxoplasma gondii MAS]PUA85632.1 putative transmembrane protein [Toxoplasma gondii TgCATBr9]